MKELHGLFDQSSYYCNSNPYYVFVTRMHFARNMSCHYSNVVDEIFAAFDDVLLYVPMP